MSCSWAGESFPTRSESSARSMATSCEFAISLGSKRSDLREVCDLAARGLLRIDVERFAFADVETAYQKLREGKLSGRAVITFDD